MTDMEIQCLTVFCCVVVVSLCVSICYVANVFFGDRNE